MSDLDAKIKEWLEWDKNPKTRAQIEDLVKKNNKDELSKILLKRIGFGTAGLRGKMSAGYSCMNDLVIIQTAQGFLKHLQKTDPDTLKRNGLVIGYDGRHNSKRWAELTALIFSMFGQVPVYLFSTVVPTPFVAFSVKLFGASAGVMVTASHNPKDDNGYKVYGANGAQISSPTDKQIQASILENLTPWCQTVWSIENLKEFKNVSDPLEKVCNEYVKIQSENIIPEHRAFNGKTELKFTYTAMHGVGYNYVVDLFKNNNLEVTAVEQQRDPDPDFPTVKFPNPEEGTSALNLSIETADKIGSTVIIANDPDADRMAIAEKNKCSGKWKIFNGNELGALLAFWAWHCHQTKYPNDCPKKVYMLASTVSSKICRSIAEQEGFNFLETLTGFKWMGNKAVELIKEGKKVIFAFEEAIGYMMGTDVLDKDGVSAALHIATMACYLKHHRLTLHDQLEEIYKEYGLHISKNSYYICHEPEIIKQIFERIRNFDGINQYPKSICNGKYEIKNIRDLTTGYDSSQPDKKAILPTSKSSQMITFDFTNGLVCTLRTSGTEPKLKYYTEIRGTPGDMDHGRLESILKDMVNCIIEEFLEPTKNNIKPQDS